MSTIRCDIDGCDFTRGAAGRGFQQMGLHRLKAHGLGSGQAPKPTRVEDDGTEVVDEVPAEPATPAERTPRAERVPAPVETSPRRKRSFAERLGFKKKATEPGTPTRERAPKRAAYKGKRVPLDTDISTLWRGLGKRMEQSAHYPTGRMLQYQAPAAGVIIDKALAGTLPDRMLFQPMARNRDKYEDVGFLLAGPLITFALTRSYQMLAMAQADGNMEAVAQLEGRIGMQQEAFEWVLAGMLPRLVEGKKIADEKKAKEDAMVAEAFPELAAGESPARALADMLFAPPAYVHQSGGTDNGEANQPTGDDRGSSPMADRGGTPGSAWSAA